MDRNSKDFFAEAFQDLLANIDKGLNSDDIQAMYIGNFTNDFFVHQSHWGPILSDLIGRTPKPVTRTEGAYALSALAFREGVFAIAST
jgi:acetyl-CoA C-acetyltransferase